MAQFIQHRRNIPVELICKSEPMYYYLGGNKGGMLIGATQRIATMYQATEDNESHRQVVQSIFENLINQLEQDAADYKRETDAISRTFRKKSKILQKNMVDIPKTHAHTIGVTHPIFHRILGVVHSLDNNMATLEKLWLMGFLDEQAYKNAKMKLASVLTLFSNNVFQITNQLRSTTKARGNTRHQINQQIKTAVETNSEQESEIKLSNIDGESTNEAAADVDSTVSDLDGALTSVDSEPLTDDDIGQMLGAEEMKESA
ncbi:hypothetical protein ACRZ5S_23055 (plasmid) [Vibrio scophthalmi]|uniref:hypothetical protein n=1 Tax=Vibrio scophthalmi TaxID=45658 RepID=UPI003EBC903B